MPCYGVDGFYGELLPPKRIVQPRQAPRPRQYLAIAHTKVFKENNIKTLISTWRMAASLTRQKEVIYEVH